MVWMMMPSMPMWMWSWYEGREVVVEEARVERVVPKC